MAAKKLKLTRPVVGEGTAENPFAWNTGFPRESTSFELRLAMAAERGQEMRKRSYQPMSEVSESGSGKYTLSREDAFIKACKEAGLPDSTWYLIFLADHWCNDLHGWAKSVINGKWDKFFDGSESPQKALAKELNPKGQIEDVKVPTVKQVKTMFDATDRAEENRELKKIKTATGGERIVEVEREDKTRDRPPIQNVFNEVERKREVKKEHPERWDGMS